MIRISIVLFIGFWFLTGCSRKVAPIIFQDTVITNYDTIELAGDVVMDTIFSRVPCDSFVMVVRKTDTLWIREVKKETKTKLVIKTDTVFRTPIITQNINRNRGQIGNENINSKTKKGDNVTGDGNTISKPIKKTNWFWIFVCGMGAMFILQNVVWKTVKRYIPILNFTA